MCGRYLTPDEAALEREWNTRPGDVNYFQSFNLAPTQQAPVVIDTDGDPQKTNDRQRSVMLMTWGFQPFWSNRAWINARSETVFVNRAFARVARRQRCLVIAAGWYEWTGTKAPKQPHLFKRKDGRSFAFAGIWTTHTVEDQKISTYAILTTDADELSAPIHNRMPLIVDPLLYDAWLWPDSDPQNYGAVIENPHADGGFEVFPVSKAVNSPKNNSPELVNRIALAG
jgi:putative SOS response-associated peptidase YedK